jgi:hypothetical protein
MSTPTQSNTGSKPILFVSCSNPDLNDLECEQDPVQPENTLTKEVLSQEHEAEFTTEQIEIFLDKVQLPTNLVFVPKKAHCGRSTIVDKVPSSIKRSLVEQDEGCIMGSSKKNEGRPIIFISFAVVYAYVPVSICRSYKC